jgi:hypothetical protein
MKTEVDRYGNDKMWSSNKQAGLNKYCNVDMIVSSLEIIGERFLLKRATAIYNEINNGLDDER